MNRKSRKSVRTGLTLVEIIISLAILMIIFSLGAPLSVNFYQSQALLSERDIVVGLLRRARALSLSNSNTLAHGVYISSTEYTLFGGDSYALRVSAYDETFQRGYGVVATGTVEIVFKKKSGDSASSTVVLMAGGKIKSISVGKFGEINW